MFELLTARGKIFVRWVYYTWGLAILADSLLFSVNNILAGLWLNCISSVEITLFLLADILLQHRASHEKINGHRELTVTTVVTTPGPNDHGSLTAKRGHISVTARSQLSHGEVTAQSRRGHSSITASSV